MAVDPMAVTLFRFDEDYYTSSPTMATTFSLGTGKYLGPSKRLVAVNRTLSGSIGNAVTYFQWVSIQVPEDVGVVGLECWQGVAASDSGSLVHLGLYGPHRDIFQAPLMASGSTSATATAGFRTVSFAQVNVKRSWWLHLALRFASPTTAGTNPQFGAISQGFDIPVDVTMRPGASIPTPYPYINGLAGNSGMPSSLSGASLTWGNNAYPIWINLIVA